MSPSAALRPSPAARPVVYADSLQALQLARAAGLPADALVRTNAPAILCDPAAAAERADERQSAAALLAMRAALAAAVEDIRAAVRAGPQRPGREEAAMVAGGAILAEFQGHLFAASMLRDGDLAAGLHLVAARYGDADMARRFRLGLADLLDGRDGVAVHDVEGAALTRVDEPTPPAPRLRERLANATAQSMLFRAGMAAWRRLPAKASRGDLYVYRENELLKEAAAWLMLRGYAVRALPGPAPAGEAAAWPEVREVVREAVARRLRGLVAGEVLPVLAESGAALAAGHLRRFAAGRQAWLASLRVLPRRPRAVLSNRLHGPDYWALCSALAEGGIPLIAFQHGVTAEIGVAREGQDAALENSGADLSLVFNDALREMCEANPLARGPALTVGMPRDYRRLARLRRRVATAPVWYVRTTLYHSNLGRLHRGLSDPAMCDFERRLVAEVFANLPHRVAYKPYPAIRYLDPDPVEELVRRTPNMVLYEDRLDLRYLVAEARVLVTFEATSTVSWCLMSGRPLVFLDGRDGFPLKPEARRAFEDAVFLFDLDADGALERMAAFLAQPLERIEAAWRAKAEARRRLVRRFVDQGEGSAGRKAAAAIARFVTDGRRDR